MFYDLDYIKHAITYFKKHVHDGFLVHWVHFTFKCTQNIQKTIFTTTPKYKDAFLPILP